MLKTPLQFLWALFLSLPCAAQSQFDCARISHRPELAGQLREAAEAGRLILVLRHTEKGGSTERKGCRAPEDALNDKGKQQAGEIARHLGRLGLNFSLALSSPYCRTLQTAELAAGREVEADERLLAWCQDPRMTSLEDSPLASEIVSAFGSQGSNTLLVTHSTCLEGLLRVEVPHLAPELYGLAAFLDPQRDDPVIGCLLLKDWDSLDGRKQPQESPRPSGEASTGL